MLIPCYTRAKQNTIPTCYLSAGWVSGSLPPQSWDLRSKSLKKLWSHLALLLFLIMTMMMIRNLFLDDMNQWLLLFYYVIYIFFMKVDRHFGGDLSLGTPFSSLTMGVFQVLSLERRWEKAFVDPSVDATWGIWGLVIFEVWPLKTGKNRNRWKWQSHDLQVVG